MSCGVGHRQGSDQALLVATAPIQPLAWELPYPAVVALKRHTHKKVFHDRGSSLHGTAETNLTRTHEDAGLIPGLAQCVGDLVLH